MTAPAPEARPDLLPEASPLDGRGPVPSVRVLGPLAVALDGQPVDVGGPRQRAVLARLIAERGRVVSTDRLLDDLWEGEPPPKALASLQVHVSHLRRALEPHRRRREPATVLVSAAPGYRLELPADTVDAWAFEARVREADTMHDPSRRSALLTEALAVWSGEAYAEFGLVAWARPEAERLEELRLRAVELRAEAELATGRTAAVVPELERHLHDHPLREDAVRLLALALYRTGRQADALAVLRRARERLADELGVDPGPVLRALEADVLAHDPRLLELPAPVEAVDRTEAAGRPDTRGQGAGSGAVAATPGPVPAEVTDQHAPAPPGREADLDQLLSAAATVRQRGTRIAWLAGEAGEGKTTLATAFSQRLGADGWQVAWGRCPEVEGVPPGWVWSEVLRALPPAPEGTAAERNALIGELENGRPDRSGAFGLARALAAQLGGVAQSGPLLVVLDDVHRADGLTLQTLRQVVADRAGAGPGVPMLVLGTFRASEAPDELQSARAALATATADWVTLAGLDRDGVAVVARQAGLTEPDEAALDLLVSRTGGNPLFVRELARLLAAEGPRTAGSAVPTGVREVLRRRIARLPSTAVAVLRQASVLGRTVDVDLLVAVSGRAESEVLDALEFGVLAGLLDEPEPGTVRFTHALVRDTLYDDLPLLRRVRLHAQALQELLRRRPDDVAGLARHASASATAGTAALALPHVVAAARQADALGANAEAAALWADAVRVADLAGPLASEADLELLCNLVAARARQGDVGGARAARARALGVVDRLPVADRRRARVRALASWDAPVIYSIRQDRLVDEALVTALTEVLDDPAELDVATYVRLLVSLAFETEGAAQDRALEAAARALDLARTTDDPRTLCAALGARVFLALGPEGEGEQEALARELLDVAQQHGVYDFEVLGHFHMFLVAAGRTRLLEARGHADRALERAGGGQFGLVLGAVTLFSAVLDVLRRRFDAARTLYDVITARMVAVGAPNSSYFSLIRAVVIGFATGTLRETLPAMQEFGDKAPGLLFDVVTLALLDAGREDEARRYWAVRRPLRRDFFWSMFAVLRGYAAARLGDVEEAAASYDELVPFSGRIAGLGSGSVAFGPVDAALAELADVLGRPDDAERHRRAADLVLADVAAQLTELERGSGTGPNTLDSSRR